MQKLTEAYPTQTDGGDPNWPHGAPRDVSTPYSTDGTPWDENVAKDLLGPLYALLNAAGVTPSGIPERPNGSQVLQSLVELLGRHEDQYTTPGTFTWTKKAWAKWIRVLCVGGGGSSDGGNQSSSPSTPSHGAGSGYLTIYEGPAAGFPGTASVRVGTGGAAPSVPSGLGANGQSSYFEGGNVKVLAMGGEKGTFSAPGSGYSGGGWAGIGSGVASTSGGGAGLNGPLRGVLFAAGVYGAGERGYSGCGGGVGGASPDGGGGGAGGPLAGYGPLAMGGAGNGRGGAGYGGGGGGSGADDAAGPGSRGCVIVIQFAQPPAGLA